MAVARTKEQERLHKRRQRERRKEGEWLASVKVYRRGLIKCLVLHGLLDADTRHDVSNRTR
jgi:hypothetical protein